MKVTLRGRVSKTDEALERRKSSTQRNVYLLQIEQEAGAGRPHRDRIEIVLNDMVYRLEFDPEGLVLSGHQESGLPVARLTVDPQSANTVIIRGIHQE